MTADVLELMGSSTGDTEGRWDTGDNLKEGNGETSRAETAGKTEEKT